MASSLLRAEEGLPRGVQGAADPRFSNVIRIFAGLSPGRRFGGGALAVYIDGKPVVDVWTGWSDRDGTTPWTANTGAMVFSATKGVAATVVHRLVDRGLLDYDTPSPTTGPSSVPTANRTSRFATCFGTGRACRTCGGSPKRTC